jgi:hypothetical protein
VPATFFYGSYMNPEVLRDVGLAPGDARAARLAGHDLVIAPRANLIPSERAVAYGVVAGLAHDELERLYAHAREALGEVYLPEPVLVELLGGGFVPALCYLCPRMEPRPAEAAYVERILAPARALGFPDWYLARIASFGPQSSSSPPSPPPL